MLLQIEGMGMDEAHAVSDKGETAEDEGELNRSLP